MYLVSGCIVIGAALALNAALVFWGRAIIERAARGRMQKRMKRK